MPIKAIFQVQKILNKSSRHKNMELRLSQSISLQQKLTLVQTLNFRLMSVPLTDIDITIREVLKDPENAERVLQTPFDSKDTQEFNLSHRYQMLIERIMSGVSREPKQDSTHTKDISSAHNLEGLVLPEHLSAPDVTYKPKEEYSFSIEYAPHFAKVTKLDLVQLPPKTRGFLAWLSRQKDWMIKSLGEAYSVIGKKQSRFLFDLDPKDLLPFHENLLANETGYHVSTWNRLLRNRSVGISSEKEIVILPVRALMPTPDACRFYNVLPYINEALEDEFSQRVVLSDEKISEQIRRKGVAISRRAITKHRVNAGIPNSRERKRIYEDGLQNEPYKIHTALQSYIDNKKIIQ